MRFTIYVKEAGTDEEPWAEEYDKPVADPVTWAKETVERFNNTQPAGAPLRVLIGVRILDGPSREHNWEKTNLVTLQQYQGTMPYDTARCTVCGVTGKRYGLSSTITLDSKFKAKVYRRCDTAKAHLEKVRR
jgi:hypothetical protein